MVSIDDISLVEHCRAVLSRGSASFSRAAQLLDPATREGCYLLYTWGRHCDDVIDGQTLGHGQHVAEPDVLARRLAALRTGTEQALAGNATDLPFRALALLVRRHGIPPDLPHQLLDGMAMDVAGRRYRTLEELVDYCYCVAGVVAIMTGRIMGLEDPALLRRLGRVGEAIQLTNIARDIIDDAGAGRVYLPDEWLAAEGVPEREIARLEHRDALARIAGRLLDAAGERYGEADAVVTRLPFRPAAAVAVGRTLYEAIGTVIRQRGPRAWDQRATVTSFRRGTLTASCLVRTIAGRIRPAS